MAFKWKRKRDDQREARKGVSLCFWSIWSHILLAMGFRQHPAYHSRCTWMGCVCLCMWRGREGERETERNVEGIRCYGVTICRPRQHLFRSKFIAEISVPSVTVFSGGAFSNSSINRRKDHFQIHFMKPTSVWYQSQIRIPWEKKITG